MLLSNYTGLIFFPLNFVKIKTYEVTELLSRGYNKVENTNSHNLGSIRIKVIYSNKSAMGL